MEASRSAQIFSDKFEEALMPEYFMEKTAIGLEHKMREGAIDVHGYCDNFTVPTNVAIARMVLREVLSTMARAYYALHFSPIRHFVTLMRR